MVTASDDPASRLAAVGENPHPADWAGLLRVGLITSLSIAAALTVGWFTLRSQPLHDPIDVVGLPLIQGYSESTEQFALCAAALAVVVAAYLLDLLFPCRLPVSERTAMALVTVGGVIFVALVSRGGFLYLAFALAIGFAHVAGRLAGPNVKPAPATLCLVVVAQFVFGRPWRDVVVDLRTVASLEVLLSLAVLSLPLWYVMRRRWPEISRVRDQWTRRAAEALERRPGTILLALLLLLALRCTATDFLQIAAFGVTAVLGVRRGDAAGRDDAGYRDVVVWLGLLLLVPVFGPYLSTAYDFHRTGFNQLVTQLGAGLGVAVLVQRTMVKHDWNPRRETQSGDWRDNWWSVVPAAVFLAVLAQNLWTGLWLLAFVILLLCRRPRWRPGLRLGVLIALTLLAACCPNIGPAGAPDRFHDGQIMSALFELRHGRLLYSDVFPLRTYHLALAALGQSFLPPTLEGFHATQYLVMYLHVGAAAFLTYAWTRSSAWSLLAGLSFLLYVVNVVSTIDLGSRHAMQLWLAGLALEVLRHCGWKRMLLTGVLGILAAFVGFDGFIPVIAAVAPAIALSDPQFPGGAQFWKRRAANALFFEGVLLASPTLLLAIWQSPQSAADFWTLLADSARHMSTHYGQRLRSEEIRHLAPCFLALAAWSCVGVLRWSRLSAFQRAGGLMLLIDFLLVLLRGTARGGAVNYEAGDLPFRMLLVIGAFEGLSVLRRWSGRAMWNDRTLVALAASALLATRLPAALSDPFSLIGQLQALSPVELLREPPVDALPAGTTRHPHIPTTDSGQTLIRSRVGPNESFWPIEDALANYLAERRNPTRHTMAYTICSPAEQRRAVRDLERDPPSLVTFRPFAIDDIPFSLRYYIVSQYLFAHYQPSDVAGYLEPRRDGWTGYDRFPEAWGYPLPLGRLAARWGAERLPRLTVSQSERLTFSILDDAATDAPDDDLRVWQSDIAVDPSKFNYLIVRLPTPFSGPMGTNFAGRLEFASPGEDWDDINQITWTIAAGDRTFLLPVGCSPGWAWRKSIARLRVVLPEASGGSPSYGNSRAIESPQTFAPLPGPPPGTGGGRSAREIEQRHTRGDATPDVELIRIDELDMATSSDSSLK